MSDEPSAGLDRARLQEAIAHDLNNLLTAVGGCADQLKSAIPASDPAREDIGEILGAVVDASLLVQLMSQQAWQSEPGADDLDLEVLLRVVVRLARKLLPRTVDVRLDRLPPGATARADAARVARVLLALSSWVGQRVGSDGVIVVSVLSGTGEVTLRVAGAPSCLGVSDELPDGLEELARSIGGSLRGARCRWDLVLPGPSAERGRPARVALESVLIAEPDVHLSSFLVSALRAETTRVARSYEELFREIDERGASLDLAVVSTDLDGPGPLEGFRRLRERCPELPVAWIAGDSTSCEALDSRILDDPLAILLPKPFGVARLTEAIHDMVQSR